MTTEEIRILLNDIESDRVERTISTTNTEKFGQAICAFANDLPDHRQSGYLFLGVEDNGMVSGISVTDELLKNLAAIRTDGNIQPQPSMSVEKVALPEGDIVMVRGGACSVSSGQIQGTHLDPNRSPPRSGQRGRRAYPVGKTQDKCDIV